MPTGQTDIQVNMVTGVIGDGTSQNPQDSGKGGNGGKRTDPSRGQAQVTTAYDNSRNALFGGGSSGGTSGGSGSGGNGGNGGRQPNLGGHANDSGSTTTRSKKSLLGISDIVEQAFSKSVRTLETDSKHNSTTVMLPGMSFDKQ